MFEARQGCAARECAAQGLLKLASGRGEPRASGWVVHPKAHAGQTHASCVPGLALEAGRRAAAGGGVAAEAVTEALARLTAAMTPVDAAGVKWEDGEGMYLL